MEILACVSSFYSIKKKHFVVMNIWERCHMRVKNVVFVYGILTESPLREDVYFCKTCYNVVFLCGWDHNWMSA